MINNGHLLEGGFITATKVQGFMLQGARLIALLIFFKECGKVRRVIALLKRDALEYSAVDVCTAYHEV